jgi:8-oxo-dGTP diphosphatase
VNAVDTADDYHYVVPFMVCETADEPVNVEPDKCEGWEWADWASSPHFDTKLFLPLKLARDAGYTPFGGEITFEDSGLTE